MPISAFERIAEPCATLLQVHSSGRLRHPGDAPRAAAAPKPKPRKRKPLMQERGSSPILPVGVEILVHGQPYAPTSSSPGASTAAAAASPPPQRKTSDGVPAASKPRGSETTMAAVAADKEAAPPAAAAAGPMSTAVSRPVHEGAHGT